METSAARSKIFVLRPPPAWARAPLNTFSNTLGTANRNVGGKSFSSSVRVAMPE